MEYDCLCGIILAGGKSTRFGSNKAVSILNGKTFLEIEIDLLSKYCKEVFISSGKEEYSFVNIPKIKDVVKEMGPIGGIYSSLLFSDYEFNLFLPCDMPLVNDDKIIKLIGSLSTGRVSCFSLKNGRVIPFPLVIPKTAIHNIRNNIIEGILDIYSNIRSIGINRVTISESELHSLKNINFLKEYLELTNAQAIYP